MTGFILGDSEAVCYQSYGAVAGTCLALTVWQLCAVIDVEKAHFHRIGSNEIIPSFHNNIFDNIGSF